MAWQLVEEVIEHAPAELSSAQRYLLVVIASASRYPERTCTADQGQIAERAHLSTAGLSQACLRLARAGVEVRVEISRTKADEPLFAVPGRALRFHLPHLGPLSVECRCRTCAAEGRHVSDLSTVDRPGDNRAEVRQVSEVGPTGVGDRSDTVMGQPRHGDGSAPTSVGPLTVLRENETDPRAGDDSRWRVAEHEREHVAALVVERLGCSTAEAHRAMTALEGNATGPIRSLRAYVEGALKNDPQQVRRLARGEATSRRKRARADLPPPCGDCDARPDDPPAARLLTDGSKCPQCHPAHITRKEARHAS